ncbi:Nlrc3, partial [Symbiodinium pilosum]
PGTAELPCAGALPPAPGDPEGSGYPQSRFHAMYRSIVQDGLHALQAPSSEHYDLGDKSRLADFLIDADIRLVTLTALGWLYGVGVLFCLSLCLQVRAEFLKKLHRSGLRFPRRQEAEAAYVGSRTALVTHEELRDWAEGRPTEIGRIVSLSHCWEAREHADPYGYQLEKLAGALEDGDCVFIDYISLYQFKRLRRSEESSFRKAMCNMHVLYSHEHTRTLRIERLTPEDRVKDAKLKSKSIEIYHASSGFVRHVLLRDLVENRTPYCKRGWCYAEMQWSSTRSASHLSREVDSSEDDAAGVAPMSPETFRTTVADSLKFTHRSDAEEVIKLQERVFKEKASSCETLSLSHLSAAALGVGLEALSEYPMLESPGMHSDTFRQQFCSLSFNNSDGAGQGNEALQIVVLQKKLTELQLDQVVITDDVVSQVAEVLHENQTLKRLSLRGCHLKDQGGLLLVEALRTNRMLEKLDVTENHIPKSALAMASAIAAKQVTCAVSHELVEFLQRAAQ